ncbi:Zn-dependent hydrolase [Mesorhizobium shangrilense]|uniref:Zn-dependent hydrolase n=1 Tax=Mesorhizobium shangrilense TaxID=460060 RepID=A0ABV2D7T1_9HYPH
MTGALGTKSSATSSEEATLIDGRRLLRNLEALGQIGNSAAGGRTRLAYSPQDGQARELLLAWMREAGLSVCVDPIGNIFGTLRGCDDAAAPIMVGSHIDTVVNAGHLDGCLGVLAGLETLLSLAEAGIVPRRPIVVAAFANEEGARFSPDLMGSRVFTGELALAQALAATDADGQSVTEALGRMPESRPFGTPPSLPSAYVELHIEQGPVLWSENVAIGIVEGVQGCRWLEVQVHGAANHAGTTPMAMRRDAGVAAASLVADLARRSRDQKIPLVATAGTMSIVSGSINSVPEHAVFTVDLRDPDERLLDNAENQLRFAIARAEADHGVTIEIRRMSQSSPVRFDDALVARAGALAERGGIAYRRLVSGASHDAQMLAARCPTLMLFAPSRDGISHSPAEHTDDDDIIAAANLLAGLVRDLAEADPAASSPHFKQGL